MDRKDKDESAPKEEAEASDESSNAPQDQNQESATPPRQASSTSTGNGSPSSEPMAGPSNPVTATSPSLASRFMRLTGLDAFAFTKEASSNAAVAANPEAPTVYRQFAALPHHRRQIRAFASAEETSASGNPLSETEPVGPRQKSFSSDNVAELLNSMEDENNNEGQNVTGNGGNNNGPGPETRRGFFFKALCLTEQDLKRRITPKGEETVVNVATINLDRQASNDSIDNICRICHDSPSSEKLIKPCWCKGSMGAVHRSCLERWLGESGKGSCEICGQEFNTVRVPKFRGFRSVIAWMRHPMSPTDTRNLFFDVACFTILTPLAVLSGWLCVVGAQTYANEQPVREGQGLLSYQDHDHESLTARGNRDMSNSTWTSIGLLSLTGTLVAAYMIWIYVAFRYHVQVWREWQQRSYIVTIVPLANGEYCFTPAAREPQVQGHGQGQDGQAQAQAQDLNNNQAALRNQNRNQTQNQSRGRLRERGSNSNTSYYEAPGRDDSPTTRFIQELFIPALILEEQELCDQGQGQGQEVQGQEGNDLKEEENEKRAEDSVNLNMDDSDTNAVPECKDANAEFEQHQHQHTVITVDGESLPEQAREEKAEGHETPEL